MNVVFSDILGQPDSLRNVIRHHSGDGRDHLARAAAEIRHARQVIFTGMGSSLFAAMPCVALLNAHGRFACAIEASELLYYHRAFGRDMVAILVSRSGETVEVVKLTTTLRERGVRIIGVTNVEGSHLATHSDIVIDIRSAPDRLIALQTYTGTVATLLALASEAACQPTKALDSLPNEMESLIDTHMGTSDAAWSPWSGAPWSDATRIYLLGRGASLGSALEGALLFHETARTPAIAMSCAQFRHGPVEAVSSDMRAFVFATQRETRELDVALAQDLRALGASAFTISFPSISSPWASVLDIIPVQIAAARLAEWRAIPPASFRYAPMVTVDETGFANPATRIEPN